MSSLKIDNQKHAIRRRIFNQVIPDFAKKSGLEIGALCLPLLTPKEADIKYYDICDKETLIQEFGKFYPEHEFVNVDYVAGKRSMNTVLGDLQFDYFIANHVVEHMPDFIGFFNDAYHHLKPGGIFFLAIPDRRFSFDVRRSETTAGHLIVDHEDYGKVDAAEHILDSLIYHEDADKFNIYWEDIVHQRYNFVHHHHVFNYENFLDKIIRPLMRMRYFKFDVELCQYDKSMGNEFILVLRKSEDLDHLKILGKTVPRQPAKINPIMDECDYETKINEILQSDFFDAQWYVEHYPEVANSGLDPVRHYFFWGAFNQYNPSPKFDSEFYLTKNPDVRQVGLNPLWHYLRNGIHEGRKPLPEAD